MRTIPGVHARRSRCNLKEFREAVLTLETLLQKRQGDVSAAEMQEIIGRRERQTRKIFRRLTGLNLRTAQLRERLKPAQALVRHTSVPIADLAALFGYSKRAKFDQSYVRAFRVTPKQDRVASRLATTSPLSAGQGVDSGIQQS
jgi:transcriptional regulator GlxA family with amidase domain